MQSLIWNIINSGRTPLQKRLIFSFLVLGSVGFSIPRYREVWFVYALIAFPLFTFAIIALIRIILEQITQLCKSGLGIIALEKHKSANKNWWNGLSTGKHMLFCIFIGIALALFSLIFNANTSWTRYSDALGIFYMGFMVGEIFYLVLLSPLAINQLKNYKLNLSPLDPANTLGLRKLAEYTFSIALITGLSLLVLNLMIALASIIFKHLRFGVLVLSATAWMTIFTLAIYPHLIFWQIVRSKKDETLQVLEERLSEQFDLIIQKNKSSQLIENLLKMQERVLNSKALPISNTEFISLVAALILNVIPAIFRYVV